VRGSAGEEEWSSFEQRFVSEDLGDGSVLTTVKKGSRGRGIRRGLSWGKGEASRKGYDGSRSGGERNFHMIFNLRGFGGGRRNRKVPILQEKTSEKEGTTKNAPNRYGWAVRVE